MEEIRLQRVDEERNMWRFYIIRRDLQMPLFGGEDVDPDSWADRAVECP